MLVVNELFIEIHKNHPLSSAQLRFWPSVRRLLAAGILLPKQEMQISNSQMHEFDSEHDFARSSLAICLP